MRKLLFWGLLGLALLWLTGCEEKENTNTKPVTKCEVGKCDTAMEKDVASAEDKGGDK